MYSDRLRLELGERNRRFLEKYRLPGVSSHGAGRVIVYEPQAGRHGNFLPATYQAILENAGWNKRLGKVHTAYRSSLPKADRKWCELDSSTSSDALLMNVFCYPGVFENGYLASMLGLAAAEAPQFGFRARVPLLEGMFDRTEVDMRLGELLVESKLTEGDFQSKPKAAVEAYRDFREVFNRRALPQAKDRYEGYQLIRNVLAAHALNSSFCVITDARRPDLIEAWYAIMRCVKVAELRLRCKVLTWQELSESLPEELQAFLDEKYGIRPGPIAPYVFEHLQEME